MNLKKNLTEDDLSWMYSLSNYIIYLLYFLSKIQDVLWRVFDVVEIKISLKCTEKYDLFDATFMEKMQMKVHSLWVFSPPSTVSSKHFT